MDGEKNSKQLDEDDIMSTTGEAANATICSAAYAMANRFGAHKTSKPAAAAKGQGAATVKAYVDFSDFNKNLDEYLRGISGADLAEDETNMEHNGYSLKVKNNTRLDKPKREQ